MTLSDDEIIDGILQQDERVFKQVVDGYYPTMYSIAASISGHAVADEVVQEAWLSVMRALPKFERRSSFKTWLMRIVANEAKTRRRKESRMTSMEAIDEEWMTDPRFSQVMGHWAPGSGTTTWHTDSPDELIASEELQDCIEQQMESLSDMQRQVIAMRDLGGMAMDEICNMLDISSSNARVLLHRARDKVLQVIDRFERLGEC